MSTDYDYPVIVSKSTNFRDSEPRCCETWQRAFNFLICPPLADMHPSKAPLPKATPGVQFRTSQLLLANNKAKGFKYCNKFIKNPKVSLLYITQIHEQKLTI